MVTRPGINQTFDITAFNIREQRIIRRLSEDFYVTRAAKITQVGNSNYRAFLMRPAEDMSVVLNVEREIVVLFAEYDTFEARTLHAFDQIYRQFDDVRVDSSLRFLISADKDIQNIIRHYIQQNPEYPIIIPFHYNDFFGHRNNHLSNAIRQNYLIRDLFGYQLPLKHEYFFFGRSQFVENILDLHKSGQNSGLFGLRKSGKTSTIYAIQRRAKTSGCRTLLLDCQDPAVHAKRSISLLEYIVVRARQEFGLKQVNTALGPSPDQASENFRRLMTNTLNDAQTDILLIFDEIENISPKTAASSHWRETSDALLFWQTLRAFVQQTKKFRLTFCFVGTNPHLFETAKIGDIDNPVYLFAPKTFIPMLTNDETREMISRLGFFMGLDFDSKVVNHIHNRFGGHPFFIRQLCSKIHKLAPTNRPHTVSLAACKLAEQDSSSDIISYLNEILASLKAFYADEYAMLEYLARDDAKTFQEMANFSTAYVEHLIGYGIITRRDKDYEFAFDLVESFVKSTLSSNAETSLEEKWKEISRRRNDVETEIRGFLFRSYMRVSDEIWAGKYNSAISEKRRETLGKLTRREAFSRTQSPLFFSELLRFVKECGEFEHSNVPLATVISAMDAVNKQRIDAHAKDISENDYLALTQSLEILEGVFLPP